jgi:hypothetical protein
VTARRRLPHLRHDDWQSPRCTLCRGGREGTIDLLRVEKLLADRAKLKSVAATFGLKSDALRRHWLAVSTDRKNYLRAGRQLSQDAVLAAINEEKISTLDHLRVVRGGLHRLFQHAVEVDDHSGGAALASALDKNIMHGAQLAGEWQPGPSSVQNNLTVYNMPGAAKMILGIARALQPFPQARRAVQEFLRSHREQQGVPMIEATANAADD